MPYPYSMTYTPASGQVVLPEHINTSNQEHINNNVPASINDYSTDVSEMRTTTDPYPAASESLADSLAGELERIRYVLKQGFQTSQWYLYPDLVTKTTTYTITVNDRVILMDATGGDFTCTLPTAVGNTDKVYHVVKIDSSVNVATLDQNGTETINGSTAAFPLSTQWDFVTVVSDNANWIVINTNVTIQSGFWVNFNATAPAATYSRNVASITDNAGAGNFTINYTNNAPDANYVVYGSGRTTSASFVPIVSIFDTGVLAVGSCRILCVDVEGTPVDPLVVCVEGKWN